MTLQELIDTYRIYRSPYNPDMLQICEADKCKRDDALPEIKAKKAEILAYIAEKDEAEYQAHLDKIAKEDAIPGLKELRAAIDARTDWHGKFSASFEGEGAIGGMGVGGYPQEDPDALRAKYPAAAAYLAASKMADRMSLELSDAGKAAMEKIRNDPADYQAALYDMTAANTAYCERHIWD